MNDKRYQTCPKCSQIFATENDCTIHRMTGACDPCDNTKHAGDVKRYDTYPDPDDKMKEHKLGDWVKFDSIAHLLKPQEPGEDWKDRHDTVTMTAKFWQMNCESKFQRIEKLEAEVKSDKEYIETLKADQQIKFDLIMSHGGEIQELRAENKRLLELIIEANHFLLLECPELESDYEDFKDRWREALNSGGAE